MTVADTDVLIDFLAGRQPAARQVEAGIASGRLVTTVISRFELFTGAQTPAQESKIRSLLEVVPSLPVTEEAADRAADVCRALQRIGQTIGSADSLIAGIVVAHGAELLTRNRRHFERVAGLRLAAPIADLRQ